MSSVSSIVRASDADASIAFLTEAFGFKTGDVHRNEDGTIGHAEVWHDGSCIMLGPAEGEHATQPATVYVVVADADAHHARAKAAGAEIVTDLRDTDYGSRDYAAKDPDGNSWWFGTYRPAAP